MPIDEIAGSAIGGVFRFLGWIFFEVIIEIFVKGLGYLICRPFKKVDLDSTLVVIVGLFAWVLIIVLVIFISDWLIKNTEIDSCLDDGGRYNYQENICEFK